jgi:hypothetical protein
MFVGQVQSYELLNSKGKIVNFIRKNEKPVYVWLTRVHADANKK